MLPKSTCCHCCILRMPLSIASQRLAVAGTRAALDNQSCQWGSRQDYVSFCTLPVCCSERPRAAVSGYMLHVSNGPQDSHGECCSVGLGYDDGTVLIKIGREEPVASMDASGKIIWARQNEVQTANVKALGSDFNEVGHPCCPAAQLSYRRRIAHAPTARQRVCLALHDWLHASRLWPALLPLPPLKGSVIGTDIAL